MNRKINQYQSMDPGLVSGHASRASIFHLLKDLRDDVLELHSEIERLEHPGDINPDFVHDWAHYIKSAEGTDAQPSHRACVMAHAVLDAESGEYGSERLEP